MEDTSNKKIGFRAIVEHIPGWIQALAIVGGMIFSMGVLHNEVQNLSGRVDRQENYPVEISNLQLQISQANKTQSETNLAVSRLADAVNSLSVSMAKLQGQLEAEDKKQ